MEEQEVDKQILSQSKSQEAKSEEKDSQEAKSEEKDSQETPPSIDLDDMF